MVDSGICFSTIVVKLDLIGWIIFLIACGGHSSFSVIGFRFYWFYRIMRELKNSSSKISPPPPPGSEFRHWLSSNFHALHATIWANSPICWKPPSHWMSMVVESCHDLAGNDELKKNSNEIEELKRSGATMTIVFFILTRKYRRNSIFGTIFLYVTC